MPTETFSIINFNTRDGLQKLILYPQSTGKFVIDNEDKMRNVEIIICTTKIRRSQHFLLPMCLYPQQTALLLTIIVYND